MPKVAALVALLTLFAIGLAGCERSVPAPTTVVIVRHAEKASQEADAPLSDAGHVRASALADALANAGVSAIYSSQYGRNKDTVAPLAARAGVAVTERPVDLGNPGDYGARLVAEIREKNAGQTVVVVSHQNTVPAIVGALTGTPGAPLGDGEYDRLTIVTIGADGRAREILARYGAPSA
jgi:broad specificity phosphatase PhoE